MLKEIITLLIALHSIAALVCPETALIAPCTCTAQTDGTAFLNCNSKRIGDSVMNTILDDYLATENVLSLGRVDLSVNVLEHFPVQLNRFPDLNVVSLKGNLIITIPSAAFKFTRTPVNLDLSDNRINAIGKGAFQGNFTGRSIINLANNFITRLDSDVFLSPALEMESVGSYSTTYIELNGNRIECNTDPCKLTWLIRDYRELLAPYPKIFVNGLCTNGTLLAELNPDSICPFDCPSPNGNFADPASCSDYYTCIDSFPYRQTCSSSLVFNPITEKCDVPANVPGCD